jgi:ubiquinone/menaquinone biosynthesis C-methylase UbiE
MGPIVASDRRLRDVVDQFDRQSHVLPNVKWFADAKRAGELLAFGEFAPTDGVLEVGCGPGIVLEAAKAAALLVGIDVSPGMLLEAMKRAPSAHLARAMGERIPLRDGSFNLVYSRSVLHHVLNPAAVIQEMARVIRKGGRLLVNDSVATENPAEAENHNLVERLRDPSHGRMVAPSELKRFFEAARLRIVAVRAKRYERDLEEWLDITAPPQTDRSEAVRLFRQWVSHDSSGLRVRRVRGRIRFDHTQWTMLGRRE